MRSITKLIILSIFAGLYLQNLQALASNNSALMTNWQTVGQPRIEHFNTADIVTSPQTYEIQQDNKGYIYIGTGNGLLIYNGKNWQHLKPADQQAMRGFVLSEDGRIYVGIAGDLGYFEPDKQGNWNFVSILNKSDNPPSVNYVYKVHEIGEYIVYITDTHLFYYHPLSGLNWHDEKIDPTDVKSLGHELLVTTRHGRLLTFNCNLSFALVKSQTLLPAGNSLSKKTRFSFAQLKNSSLFINTDKKLITIGQNDQILEFKTEIDDWLKRNVIMKVVEISKRRLAIATEKGGIAIINKQGQLIRFINTNHGLVSNGVNSIFQDREGSLWVSSSTNGVSRIEIQSGISQFPSNDEFFLSASVVEFMGRTFMGAQHGLFVLNPAKTPNEQAQFVKLKFNYLNTLSLVNSSNALLIGHDQGIDTLTIDNNGNYQVEKITDQHSDQITHVRKIIIDNQNPNIAFAIASRGIVKLHYKNNKWQSLGLMDNFNKRLFSIHQRPDGQIWVGTSVGQYFKISQYNDWPKSKISQLDYPQLNPPMAGGAVQFGNKSLFNNGVDQVVMMLSEQENKLVPADFADWSLYDVTGLMKLVPSNSNRAWFLAWINDMNMDRIGRLAPKGDNTFKIDFLELDRLRLEFTLGLFDNQQGTLWINTKGRVIRYDHGRQDDQNEHLLFTPLVNKITEVGSEELLFNHAKFQILQSPIQLVATQNTINIDFGVADFIHSETVEFRYRLSEQQTEWSEWHPKSNAIFTNLAPGDSQFELQYRTTPSSLSPILKFAIHRQPFWYQSLAGQLSIVTSGLLLLFLAAWGIARARILILRQKARELEKQVSDRTLVIEQQNTQLKQMDQAKNRFFTNVSHEFRTPLSLAIGPLKDVIAGGRVNDQKDLDYLNISLTNNIRMMELLSQVLDINKLEANGMPLKVVKMEVAANLLYCIQRFQQVSEKRSVRFKTIGFDNNTSIYFDADHFEKIILNLISNAVKFSPKNSEITVEIKIEDSQVEVCIIDRGIGISPDDLPHIFSRFYQGQQPSQTIQPGTGIGLSLVRELITLHGGKINAKSDISKGSCFCVIFLRGHEHYEKEQISDHNYVIPSNSSQMSLPVEATQPDNKNIEQTGISMPINSSHKTLLIIDDNSDLRAFIRSGLESTYNIIEASNGRTGLESAKQNQPDLIVSDVMMPVMDGLQLAKELKANQHTAHIPLILLTAKSTKRDTVEGLQQGADDYLSKPFDSAELAARIASQLAQKQRIAEKIRADFKQNSQKNTSPDPIDENTERFEMGINQLILNNMGDETFDVEKMYQGLNITRSTLFRQVKKAFSCTPNQLLKLRRLEVALKMLQQNKGSISEVGYATGFQSLSVFSRAFSDKYQVPPSRFSEI